MQSALYNYLGEGEFSGGAILGGKTGYTDEAGLCLASLARVDGKEYAHGNPYAYYGRGYCDLERALKAKHQVPGRVWTGKETLYEAENAALEAQIQEQALADGAFGLALGLPLHLGLPPFITGSSLVTQVLTEDMRELTGGLYFGARKTEEVDGVLTATDTLTYNENEIRRIAKRGFDIAMKRRKKVTSVDKANVLDSSRLWRKIVEEVAQDYPEVTYEHMLVDNCAMQLVKDPKQFDVILTENMFGDILSDEASMVTGSIGMLSSASLNDTKFGLYEPSGGSAPDIAGKGIANPIATILSAAMMLRYSFDLDREADAVEQAVKQVLKDGYRTIDIMPQEKQQEKATQVGTAQMGDLICERIR